MARNFAQIVFLIYGIILLVVSRKVIETILKKKIGTAAVRRKMRGTVNSLCYLLLRGKMAPVMFFWNLASVILLTLCALGHLTVGWFSFASLGMKLLNSAALLFTAFQAFSLSMARNTMKYGQMLILYRVEEDAAAGKTFISSVVDGILMVLLPLLMIFCNFFTL